MTPEFKNLREAVARIGKIEIEIVEAQRLPKSCADSMSRVCLGSYFRNTYDTVPGELIAVAKAALATAADQERVRGEQERDRILAALAVEIHGIRATLPGLAAKAAISLGECASDLLNPDGAA